MEHRRRPGRLAEYFNILHKPVELSAQSLAFEETARVGPGGHFFGTGNTIACYEDAFYQPLVFEGKNFDQWREDGSPDAAERAHHVSQRVLEEFEAPELSADRKDARDDFVARRTQEGGAPLD